MYTLIKIKLIKSLIGISKNHKNIIYGLGLKRINSISILKYSSSIKGMLNKVFYLIKIEKYY